MEPRDMQNIWDREFDSCWGELAKRGYCEGFASDQYQRIRYAWIAHRGPVDPYLFILDNADTLPEDLLSSERPYRVLKGVK